jgi:subtilisin family serine protease
LYSPNINTHVSSNSWGPEGCTSDGCEFYLATGSIVSAIESGATAGRGGKGKLYVFAAGNEGHYGGDANQYPYTKLKETIAVSGSGWEGQKVWYSSVGSAIFVNAPTQGSFSGEELVPGIITAQGGGGNNECRDDFGGTSSATPLVAGVLAVILSANPSLSARGMCLSRDFL